VNYNGTARIDGKFEYLTIDDKTILIDDSSSDNIRGIDRSTIRTVKTSDGLKTVIAYSENGVIRSFMVTPLDRPIQFFEALGVQPPESVIISEFDKTYQAVKDKFEADLAAVLKEGKVEPPTIEQVKPAIDLIDKFPGGRTYLNTRIWDVMSAPEQYRLAWAKVSYLIYLESWIGTLSNPELEYYDENRMRPSDWITFFKHEGIVPIESPKILERAKSGTVRLNIYPLRDPSELPKDYNTWFKLTDTKTEHSPDKKPAV
jgi:hypothetical protein